jgi:hypothetical protein
MKNARHLITAEALGLIKTVADLGCMSAAAKALDVLVFDRSAKQARIKAIKFSHYSKSVVASALILII